MAVLRPGAALSQPGPTLRVDNRLSPGEHIFTLVVTDDAGLESAPATIRIQVRPASPPVGSTGPLRNDG